MNAAMRILILDDMPTIRMIVAGMLEDLGYGNVFQAESAELGMKMLANEKFDLVLADWNLPGRNGIELLRWVRAQPNWDRLPFIMMTSNNDPRQISIAKKLGVSGYLVKPFGASDLIETIEDALAHHRKSSIAV